MIESEIYPSNEINDLTNEGKLGERDTYSSTESNSGTSTKTSSLSSSGTGGASSISSGMSAFSSIVPAVISILAVAVVAVTLALSVPTVTVSDWEVSDRKIAFQFTAADSTNPYLVTLSLARSDESIQSIETTGATQQVSFSFLQPETAYEVLIKNDYGAGVRTIKEYQIQTAGVPNQRAGKLSVGSYELNDSRDELILTLALDDPGAYLSEYHIVLANGDQEIDFYDYDGIHPFVIPLNGFERGYITVTIYAKSSYPTDENRVIKTAIYKILY